MGHNSSAEELGLRSMAGLCPCLGGTDENAGGDQDAGGIPGQASMRAAGGGGGMGDLAGMLAGAGGLSGLMAMASGGMASGGGMPQPPSANNPAEFAAKAQQAIPAEVHMFR